MSDSAELVAKYQRFRAAVQAIASPLLYSLRGNVLDEGARRLGLFHGKRYEFQGESEMAVLVDYCIYHVRTDGQTACERLLRERLANATGDERQVLEAMQRSFYSLFLMQDVIRGVGGHVIDLAEQAAAEQAHGEAAASRPAEPFLICDIGLSQTAEAGFVFAAQMLPFDEFAMASGASLPLGMANAKTLVELDRAMREAVAGQPANVRGIANPAQLIGELLAKGAAHHIHYAEPGQRVSRSRAESGNRAAPRRPAPRRLSRNDPCPCGSGKKYKHCCQRT